MLDQSTIPDHAAATPRYDRADATASLDDFRHQQRTLGTSERQFARDHELPHSALQFPWWPSGIVTL